MEKTKTLEAALEDVAQRLERDELPGHFNMEIWRSTDECNTVACIGGWLYSLHRATAVKHGLGSKTYYYDDPRLDALLNPSFYGNGRREPSEEWAWSATREQAARAIRAYLAGAERPWSAEGVL